MKSVVLRAGKERSLLRRHPWVFESSVASGRADPGETVRVQAADGGFLAWAAYSPGSAIRLRAWSFDEAERIDAAFFERRIARALALRTRLAVPSDGVRVVHGEADGLPGLIVDRYADTLVAQFLSAGAERWKLAIASALCRGSGLVPAVRALRCQRAWPRGTAPADRLAAGRRRDRGDDPRARLAVHGGHRARPQDRLLPRPARQPRAVSPRPCATSACDAC